MVFQAQLVQPDHQAFLVDQAQQADLATGETREELDL